MPSLVHTEDKRSPRVRGPATMTDGRDQSKLPPQLRALRVDNVTGNLLVGPEYFPDNSIVMYKQAEYAPAIRNTFSYYNGHVKDKSSSERVHGTMVDVGVDEEGNKNYFNFMMDKKTGLLGGPLAAYLQVRLGKTVVRFYNSKSDPVEREKWSFEGKYPKNMQDVCTSSSLQGLVKC